MVCLVLGAGCTAEIMSKEQQQDLIWVLVQLLFLRASKVCLDLGAGCTAETTTVVVSVVVGFWIKYLKMILLFAFVYCMQTGKPKFKTRYIF